MSTAKILAFSGRNVSIYKAPLPKDVGKYAGVVSFAASSSSSGLTSTQIKEIDQIFTKEEISEVRFYPRVSIAIDKPEETTIYREMMQKFPIFQTKIISSKALTPDQKIELNFFPKWTADKERAQLVLEGRYYEVMPTGAEVIPTQNCVFRCLNCSFRPPKELIGVWEENIFTPEFHMASWDIMERVLQGLKEARVENVVFTGGGEPLLNRFTIPGIQRAMEMGFTVGLYTNGALLTPEKIDALLEAQPAFVRISVNAGTPEQHRQYHCPLNKKIDHFSKIMEALAYFARRRLEVGGPMELGLSYIVNPINVKGLIPFAQKISEIGSGINFVRFTPTLDYWGGPQYSQEMFDQSVRMIKGEKGVTSYLEPLGIRVVSFSHRFENVNEQKPYQKCLAHSWFAEAGPQGELFLCCELQSLPCYRIGSLMTGSLSDTWKSPLRMAIVTRVNESQLATCPTFCKPHELNKIFSQVEDLKRNGKIEEVKEWLSAMQYLQDPKNIYNDIFKSERAVAI